MTRTPPSAAAARSPGTGAGRAAVPLLVALLVVGALLRVWYLPSSERLSSETPAIDNVQAALAGSDERDHRIAALAWIPQHLLLSWVDALRDDGAGEWSRVATARNRPRGSTAI